MRTMLLALPFLLAIVAPAQARKPCFITACDDTGKPLAGAEITCVFSASMVAIGSTDVVRATTDARGRAQPELRIGDTYTAWVIGPADAEGRRWISSPTDFASAGRVLDLPCVLQQAPRRVQLKGVEPWRAEGELRLQYRPDARHDLAVDLALPADSVVELPPSPWAQSRIALCCAGGTIQEVNVEAGAVPAALEWSPPREFEVVVDGAAGTPVVLQHFSSSRYSPAGDDPIGMGGPIWRSWPGTVAGKPARIRLPWPDGERRTLLWARAPGQGVAYANVTAVGGPTRLCLTPQPPITLQVVGEGLTGLLAVEGTCPSGRGIMPVRYEPAAVEGMKFTFDALPPTGVGLRLRLLPKDAQAPPCRVVLQAPGKPPEPPVIDLQKLRRFEIRTQDEHGVPVPGAMVVVADHGDWNPIHWQDRFAVDMAGHASLLLDEGDWLVYALTGSSHGHAIVHGGSAPGTLPLVLRPLPTMALKVVDGQGQPVALAGVQWTRIFRSRRGSQRGWSRPAPDRLQRPPHEDARQ